MKKVVVFGIFDGVHDGHRSLFSQAKKHGDHLTVLVGRDKACMELKNKKTKNCEKKRRLLVAKDPLVDRAFLGDVERSTYRKLQEINPDVICLGYDQEDLQRDLEKWVKRKGVGFSLRRLKMLIPKNLK